MDQTPSTYKKWLVVLVVLVAVVIVVLAVMVGRSSENQSATNSLNGTSTNTTGTPSLGATHTPAIPVAIQPAPAVPAIYFVAPVGGVSWNFGTQNVILWNQAGGISGQLTLVNAKTGKTVGVILDQVGPKQTYYTWNTHYVFVSRTNPAEIVVSPGSYMIKIAYDGDHILPATSPAFTIVGTGN